jgi:hypothetical protein
VADFERVKPDPVVFVAGPAAQERSRGSADRSASWVEPTVPPDQMVSGAAHSNPVQAPAPAVRSLREPAVPRLWTKAECPVPAGRSPKEQD